jgi:hypothetical protein
MNKVLCSGQKSPRFERSQTSIPSIETSSKKFVVWMIADPEEEERPVTIGF